MKTEYKPYVDALIELAIREDIGDGDHTSLCVHSRRRAGAYAPAVQAGGHHRRHRDRTSSFSTGSTPTVEFDQRIADGTRVRPGDVAFYVSGAPALAVAGRAHPAQHHAAHERRSDADRASTWRGSKGCTPRCSTPARRRPACACWTKWPSRLGGGENHRMGLFDMILLKDNHIDFAGGIRKAIRGAQRIPRGQGQGYSDRVRSALAGGHRRSLRRRRRRPHHVRQFHARDDARGGRKGRRTLRNRVERRHHARYAARPTPRCGVDFISVGALTHQIRSLDMSLKACE